MNRKIALIELYGHSEVLINACRLATIPQREILVFTNQDNFEDIPDAIKNDKNYTFHLQDKDTSLKKFVLGFLPYLQNIDFALFITLVSNFNFFAQISIPCPHILLIHNINAHFIPYQSLWLSKKKLGSSFIDVLKLIKLFLFREAYYKKRIAQQCTALIFPSHALTEYYQNLQGIHNKKVLSPLPMVFYEGHQNISNEYINISIPGTITSASRDYELVYEAFLALSHYPLQKPVKIFFLGMLKGKYGVKVKQLFNSIQHPNLSFIFFPDKVPQHTFVEIMQQTDFLILPLKKYLKYSIFREEYGYSNISGSVNEIIRYGLPTLMSEYYPMNENVESIIHRFDSASSLCSLLLDWLYEGSYLKLRKDAKKILEQYEFKVQQKVLNTALKSISTN